MFKILSTAALFLVFVLMVPAGLIMISQDAAKGDWNYPIKRGIEDVILSAVSLNPYSKAYFAVALANRRYDETEKLLASGGNADVSLKELVSQTSSASDDINKISSSQQRANLIADLKASIQKYDKGLAQAQVNIDTKSVSQTSKSAGKDISKPSPAVSYHPSSSVQQGSSSQKADDSGLNEELQNQREAIDRTRRELEELRKKLEQEQIKIQLSNRIPMPQQGNSTPLPSSLPLPPAFTTKPSTQGSLVLPLTSGLHLRLRLQFFLLLHPVFRHHPCLQQRAGGGAAICMRLQEKVIRVKIESKTLTLQFFE